MVRRTRLQPLQAATAPCSNGRSREIVDGSDARRSRACMQRRAVHGGRRQLRLEPWPWLQPAPCRRPRGRGGRRAAPLPRPHSSPTARRCSSRLPRTRVERCLRRGGGLNARAWRAASRCGQLARAHLRRIRSRKRRPSRCGGPGAAWRQHSADDTLVSCDSNDLRHVGRCCVRTPKS